MTAGAVAADPVADLAPPVEAERDASGQAGFNPFSTVGAVVQPPAAIPAPPQDGDWGLPVVVAIVGTLLTGSLLRKLAR